MNKPTSQTESATIMTKQSHQELYKLSRELMKELRRSRRRSSGRKWLWLLFCAVILAAVYVAGKFTGFTAPHVAIINIKMPIMEDSTAGANYVLPALDQAFKNPTAKAILLDINSPGGSAVHSNRVFNTLLTYREIYPEKKVYAICSDVCASGAYYMAAGADYIYADSASIVGSIGVIFGGFGYDKLIEKLGIDWRMQTAGSNKAMLDPFSPENPDHQEMLQQMLDDIHQQFISAVKRGRGDRLADSDQIFSGRFWSGGQAKELGLVDELGSVESVLTEALGGLPAIDYSIQQPFIYQMMGMSVKAVNRQWQKLTSQVGFSAEL
jgi:protease-4